MLSFSDSLYLSNVVSFFSIVYVATEEDTNALPSNQDEVNHLVAIMNLYMKAFCHAFLITCGSTLVR